MKNPFAHPRQTCAFVLLLLGSILVAFGQPPSDRREERMEDQSRRRDRGDDHRQRPDLSDSDRRERHDTRDEHRGDRDRYSPKSPHDERRSDFNDPRHDDSWRNYRNEEHYSQFDRFFSERRHGAPRGCSEIRVGHDSYFYRRGVFYVEGRHGYRVVPAPRYAVVRDLPRMAIYVQMDNSSFWRHGDAYYERCPGGYQVIEPSPRILRLSPPEVALSEAPSVGFEPFHLGDDTFWFNDGQFFVAEDEGMVWHAAPMGAVASVLPAGMSSVWHDGDEYFICDDVVLCQGPDGYRVIQAPWPTKAPDDEP